MDKSKQSSSSSERVLNDQLLWGAPAAGLTQPFLELNYTQPTNGSSFTVLLHFNNLFHFVNYFYYLSKPFFIFVFFYFTSLFLLLFCFRNGCNQRYRTITDMNVGTQLIILSASTFTVAHTLSAARRVPLSCSSSKHHRHDHSAIAALCVVR